MNLNKAILIGRLTRDPEVRTTTSGKQVASFSIANNTSWKNADGEKQEKTEFHNIVAWGKLGEICGQYLTKGQEVYIDGRIETRNWEGQDGVRRNRTEIIAENMQMGQRPRNEGGGGYAPASSGSSNFSNKPTNNPAKQEENKEEVPVIQVEEPSVNPEDKDEIKVEDIPF
jgi:single-strand DNA-binding protein